MTTAIEKRKQAFFDIVQRLKPKLMGLLPKHVPPERILRVALIAATKNPKLYECTPQSVMKALLDAAELGLEPGGAMGHAALVPYKRECTLIPMYAGLIELARRSGQVKNIEAEVVYEGDLFVYEKGTEPKLKHVPWEFRRDPDRPGEKGDIICAYAIAWLTNGGTQVEVVTKADLDKIANVAKAKSEDTPWKKWYDQQARKTAIKRLCKYLPKSAELAKAIELDNEVEAVVPTKPTIEVDLSPGRHDMKAARRYEEESADELHAAEVERVVESDAPPPEPPIEVDAIADEIDDAIVAKVITPEEFDRLCEGLGIDSNEWPKASPRKLEGLLSRIRDIKAKKEEEVPA